MNLSGRRPEVQIYTASIDRAGRRTGFIYDAIGRLVKTIFPDDTPANPDDNPFTSTEYDLAGNVSEWVYHTEGKTQTPELRGGSFATPPAAMFENVILPLSFSG